MTAPLAVSPLEARLAQALAAPGRATSDFDLNPGTVLPEGRRLREAAVLVPVVEGAGRSASGWGGARVVLTKRSPRLAHHPGQVAFPGGKVDAGDADVEAAALREAEEEIGLPRGNVRVLGRLAPHETVTGFRVTPVLALVQPFAARPEAGEVAEVFDVPLSHLADPAAYAVERRLWRGTWRNYYVVPYGPYYIWGATGRMLRALAERLSTCTPAP